MPTGLCFCEFEAIEVTVRVKDISFAWEMLFYTPACSQDCRESDYLPINHVLIIQIIILYLHRTLHRPFEVVNS